MKQKLKRFMAGFMAMLTLVGTLFTNGTTAFAASPQANIAFWNASVKNSGEVSELKPGYNHGKILYSILDGNSAYCMNFGLRADGGQLMNSYDDASTSMSAQQRKLLSYCLYYGFNSTQKAAPSNSQCDEYIATQAMVWVIVADIFGTGSGDSAARKLCNTAPSPDSSYSYYERLRDNISSSYNATLPSFASRRISEAPTYELKWNEGSQRFETTLSDSNGVLSDFDFGISGYSVDKNGKDDNDGRGKYATVSLQKPKDPGPETTFDYVDNTGKVWTCPPKGWRMTYKKIKALENDNRLYFEGESLRVKDYWNERKNAGKRIDTLWNDLPENSAASKELEKIFNQRGIFDNPKPTELIKRCLEISNSSAIVLDFFAGSGTTGQAVLELNKADDGNREFILCTNNEVTDSNPNGIAYDVTSKRLKRVMTGSCYDGTKDFVWLKDNTPLEDNLDVYEIADVSNFEATAGKTPFDVIDETLYGKEKCTSIKEKVEWVCENFEATQKQLEEN